MYKILILFSFVGVCYSSVEVFEKYFKVCNRDVTYFNDCMAEAVRHGIIAMADGITELGIESIDPYFNEDITAQFNVGDQISANFNMTNIELRGFKETTVISTSFKVHGKDFYMEINLKIPALFANGNYIAEANFNNIHVAAMGPFRYTMLDIIDNWVLKGVLEDKNGETYVRITSFTPTPYINSAILQVTNNYQEYQTITQWATAVINNNWEIFYSQFLPIGQKGWNKVGVDIANKIFQHVPYNKIFPIGL